MFVGTWGTHGCLGWDVPEWRWDQRWHLWAASARRGAPQGASSCPSDPQVECNSKLDPTNTTFLKVGG